MKPLLEALSETWTWLEYRGAMGHQSATGQELLDKIDALLRSHGVKPKHAEGDYQVRMLKEVRGY